MSAEPPVNIYVDGVVYIRIDISEQGKDVLRSNIEHMANAHRVWAESYHQRIQELKAEIAELKAERSRG